MAPTKKTTSVVEETTPPTLPPSPVQEDDIQVTETTEEPDTSVPSDVGNVMSVRNTLETATQPPRCNVMVIDNFYNNPMETRDFILTQDFCVRGNYPGVRTKSFASEEIKNMLQDYVGPSGGKIIQFPMEEDAYNGAFQITTSRDRSWIHTDGWNNWAGVLYMTPNAPLRSGTATYMHKDGERFLYKLKSNDDPEKTKFDETSQDITKWHMVDNIANVFNRLIIFNANQFHTSMDYFGQNLQDGRLFQTFFFSTER